jgi:hypothetical protein
MIAYCVMNSNFTYWFKLKLFYVRFVRGKKVCVRTGTKTISVDWLSSRRRLNVAHAYHFG